MDIAGAGYYELISWVRGLDLPETGGAEELRARLYSHYGLEPPASSPAGDVIRIEAADRTDYFRLETAGEEYVRLSGGVVLVLHGGRIRGDPQDPG